MHIRWQDSLRTPADGPGAGVFTLDHVLDLEEQALRIGTGPPYKLVISPEQLQQIRNSAVDGEWDDVCFGGWRIGPRRSGWAGVYSRTTILCPDATLLGEAA